MENVLIIGNGFDLGLGLQTQYKHFVNSEYWPLKERPLERMLEDNLFNYIWKFTEDNRDNLGEVKWIDLEELFLNYALKKSQEEVTPYFKEIANYDREILYIIKEAFKSYILNVVTHQITKRCASPININSEIIESIIHNDTFTKVYSFNYTGTDSIIEFLYGGRHNVSHLHGVVYTMTDQIILGINDDVKVPKEYWFLKKSHQDGFRSHDMNDDLFQSNEIIFYGLSFGPADFVYFKRFLKETVKNHKSGMPKKRVNIFTLDESSRVSIMENIVEFGIPMSDIYSCINFVFYKTGEYGYTQQAMEDIRNFILHMQRGTKA